MPRYDCNMLESNSPVEDRAAEAKCVYTTGNLFGVFDGHAGPGCAQATSERLFQVHLHFDTLTQAHIRAHTLSRTRVHTPPFTHPQLHSPARAHTRRHSYTLTHSLTAKRAPARTHVHAHSHTHIASRTVVHAHSLTHRLLPTQPPTPTKTN